MNTRRIETRGAAGAGGWLHVAAMPTFVVMALVSVATDGDPAGMLCTTMGHGPLSLQGMALMYLLMAVFHATPWWRAIVRLTRGRARAQKAQASASTAIESRRR
jgi:hypothetical protein